MFQTSTLHPSSGAQPAFADCCAGPLPAALREAAWAMTFDEFHAVYARSSGPLRLGNWQCVDADRPASRLGPQPRNYQATIAVGDRIDTSTAAACGPVAALTEMLHQRGVTVEISTFRQTRAGGDVVTLLLGGDGLHTEWAMGCSADATQSALRAMIACANRLWAGRG